jgi:hypothetical protein
MEKEIAPRVAKRVHGHSASSPIPGQYDSLAPRLSSASGGPASCLIGPDCQDGFFQHSQKAPELKPSGLGDTACSLKLSTIIHSF